MPCPHCPLADSGLVCPGLRTDRYCVLVAPGSPVRDEYTRILFVKAGPAPPPPGPVPADRLLVVAAYNEDLSWLASSPVPALVYCKGRARPPAGVPWVPLAAVAREAGTWLTYVTTWYDALPAVTFLAQGDPFAHAPDVLDRLADGYGSVTPLASRYLDGVPPRAVTELDRVEARGGREVRWGMADAFGQFSGGAAGGRSPGWLDRVWAEVFTGPRPSPLWFGYGAMYAVPRAAFAGRPPHVWRALSRLAHGPAGHSAVDRDDRHPLTPWALEALWWYILGDPSAYPTRFDAPPALPPPGPIDPAAYAAMARCGDRYEDAGCGCSWPFRCRRTAAAVSHADCAACLKREGKV